MNPSPQALIATLLDLLDRPIAFQPLYARISGSVTAGLMLSQAVYWTKIVVKNKPEADGWFYKSQQEWTEEICLSRWEQETARKILRGLPFWKEDRRGAPPKSYFRVDLQKLIEVAAQNVGKPHSEPWETIGPELAKASVWSEEKPHSLREGTEITSETTPGRRDGAGCQDTESSAVANTHPAPFPLFENPKNGGTLADVFTRENCAAARVGN